MKKTFQIIGAIAGIIFAVLFFGPAIWDGIVGDNIHTKIASWIVVSLSLAVALCVSARRWGWRSVLKNTGYVVLVIIGIFVFLFVFNILAPRMYDRHTGEVTFMM